MQIAPVENMRRLQRCKMLLSKTWSVCNDAKCSCRKHEAFATMQIVPVENMKRLHSCKNVGRVKMRALMNQESAGTIPVFPYAY
jgi:hypothetical protein